MLGWGKVKDNGHHGPSNNNNTNIDNALYQGIYTSASAVTGMTLGDPNDPSKSACPHLYNKTNNSVHVAVINIKLRLSDK